MCQSGVGKNGPVTISGPSGIRLRGLRVFDIVWMHGKLPSKLDIDHCIPDFAIMQTYL